MIGIPRRISTWRRKREGNSRTGPRGEYWLSIPLTSRLMLLGWGAKHLTPSCRRSVPDGRNAGVKSRRQPFFHHVRRRELTTTLHLIRFLSSSPHHPISTAGVECGPAKSSLVVLIPPWRKRLCVIFWISESNTHREKPAADNSRIDRRMDSAPLLATCVCGCVFLKFSKGEPVAQRPKVYRPHHGK